MRQYKAFVKKEFLELYRSGKGWIMLAVFFLFGIMAPAFAKLTPFIMEAFSDSLSEAGISMKTMEITAISSWQQFYKNAPLALILFGLVFSSVMTNEYQKGTFVNILTKGMKRWKVIGAKGSVLLTVWTVCYWMSYGTALAYTVYFWDNTEIRYPWHAAGYVYLFGILLITAILFFSSVFNSQAAVLGAVGGSVILFYFLEMIPALSDIIPLRLLAPISILTGGTEPGDFVGAAVTAAVLILLFCLGAVFCFNKKQI